MENVNSEKNTGLNNKKDFKPIIIYFGITFVLATIITIIVSAIVGVQEEGDVEKIALNIDIILRLVMFVFFLVMYLGMVKKDAKTLTKDKLKMIIIVSVLAVILNFVVYTVMINLSVNNSNQDTLVQEVNSNAVFAALSLAICAPFIEEILFRYSLGSIIKNNIVFVIISSILFGVMHGIGIATILYIMLGVIYSILYIRTNKNIVAPIIAHTLNNIVAVIFMFIA